MLRLTLGPRTPTLESPKGTTRPMRTLEALAILLLAAAITPAAAAEHAAEIVSVKGNGEQKRRAGADWEPAREKQVLEVGGSVRLNEKTSRMALLLADETQETLSGVTIME